MLLAGYQKISLMDYPGLIASIVFLRGCDFLCPYCHNPELIPSEGGVILEEDFFSMLLENKKMLDGVVVSGGEPCLQPGLPEFLSKIKDYGFKVKLDTNGSEPEMLEFILKRGLADYVAMDIKSSWENYPKVTKVTHAADKAKKSLGVLGKSKTDHEFRTTILPGAHTLDDFIAIAKELPANSKYFIQDIKLDKTYAEISAPSDFFAEDVARELKDAFSELIIEYR
jgi:pyruvate formate lyase activating enzyme